MFKVSTLEEICAQQIVQKNLIIHPVNCNLNVNPIDTKYHIPQQLHLASTEFEEHSNC